MELTIADMQASYRRLWIGVLCGIVLSILKIILQLWMPYGFAASPPVGLPLLPVPAVAPAPPSQSQNVTIGAASADPPELSQRAWFTTEETAAREGIAPRTLVTWIAEGRVQPPPERTLRQWRIPKDYRITPPPDLTSRQ